MPLGAIKARILAVEQLFKEVMVKDRDYGVIPGCGDKPALLKPGAERICMLFSLAPKLQITKTDLDNGHREYEVICTLVSAKTGAYWGQGVGSASTMESKHRYRKGEPTFTDRPAPRGYYDLKDRDWKAASKAIGGRGFSVRKHPETNRYMIVKVSGEKVENPDPADVFNTILKMAKKRALVDATLTASATSGLFTQDEDAFQKHLDGVEPYEEDETPQGPTQGTQKAAGRASRPTERAQPPQDTPEDQDKLLAQLQAQLVKIAGAMDPNAANDALRSAGIMGGVEQVAKIPSVEVIKKGLQACRDSQAGSPPPDAGDDGPPLWGEPGGP